MRNLPMKYVVAFLVLFSLGTGVQSRHNSDHPLTPQDWQEVMEKVTLLESSGLLPTLLPVIMGNRDALQLTDEQVGAFRDWRKRNYTNVVNVMNTILEKKVRFRTAALSPDITEDQLLTLQAEIHDLQRELLDIKLSCRELVMSTFTDEQWENFSFVLSDYPRLAGLLTQD